MASLRSRFQRLRRFRGVSVLTLLLLYVAVITVVQYETSSGHLARYASFSLLAPLAAAGLLSLWQAALVAVATLGAAATVYGFHVPQLSVGGRYTVLTSVALACLLSLLVCHIREDRERRVARLTIARERLTLLSEASNHIGSTLDVRRTAAELTDVAVPRLADLATVDLYGEVLRGEEPPAQQVPGPVTLHRVAQRSVLEGAPELMLEVGDTLEYPPQSPHGLAVAASGEYRARVLDAEAVAEWFALDPERAARVREHGVHSGLMVPLRARGATMGVAIFGRHRRAEGFDQADLLLAEEIGARAAVCLDNARRFTHERSTSLTLQRSLLPRGRPDLAAVEVASRYLPADSMIGVGGDWFDVIPLSGARVALVVGDVVGHGLYASATMGRLRATVRTLADIDLPPDELLTHLDDVVIRMRGESEEEDAQVPGGAGEGRPMETGATCLYAVYDPVSRVCSLARAGHPSPALVLPDGTVQSIELPAGPPLGLGGLPFESVEITLPEGSVLALYTDGLLESRRHDLDQGVAELHQLLAHPAPTLEATCDTVLKSLVDEHHTDDIALLVARTRALSPAQVSTWEVPAEPTAVARARELASRQLTSWGLQDAVFTTELVVSELVTNAIRHAGGPIQLRVIRQGGVICEVSDGSSTSPHLRRARAYDESGRGLFIVAHLTQRWGSRQSSTGKTIWAEVPDEPGEFPGLAEVPAI
ncbi:ATP-binding SpoIIE family protein phosphatase [Streptomyces harbinensis]|uniref:Serine phosphatase RsbU, regulator of sigma subunit n=1 Tax=Streptomyces harbinensis TaxID=1176198 RepID=A0A1I6U4S1_9ACTN|nr:SpoIIE family protein phosphatase [Streptomyces harbinensis]SFS96394.1 Serine phosphatase RsbU, regulator of sigma subunit [Streptomyces harbinensis]